MNNQTECNRCVLSSYDDPEIYFNSDGICNHCIGYENQIKSFPLDQRDREVILHNEIEKIKKAGHKREYDCIMGISGGVDSSYLSILLKEFKLRPLLIHFDNGWNSELAVNNIERIINKLEFPLYTYVVNWSEFKDLQLSYIRSGVLDWEIPTDHGFYALLHNQAFKRKINYIISGHNIVTEGILPKCMRWSKLDVANIKDIHSQFGEIKKLKTFPTMPFYKSFYYKQFANLNFLSPLNYLEYNKTNAKNQLINDYGWKDYGGKHYESIFTRFYQGYVLVEKYGFDKRKAHLSTLINSGQITKEEARKELAHPIYDELLLKEDKKYVLKKLGLTNVEFNKIMQEKPVSHLMFKSYENGIYLKHERFMKKVKPFTKLLKKLK
jgi:N-acetyl sugar amidotransferase